MPENTLVARHKLRRLIRHRRALVSNDAIIRARENAAVCAWRTAGYSLKYRICREADLSDDCWDKFFFSLTPAERSAIATVARQMLKEPGRDAKDPENVILWGLEQAAP